jgi:hypothetical protein
MNRRAFFGALAGAPVGVAASLAVAEAAPEILPGAWVGPDNHVYVAEQECSCGCQTMFYRQKYFDLSNVEIDRTTAVRGIDGYCIRDVKICMWCKKERP